MKVMELQCVENAGCDCMRVEETINSAYIQRISEGVPCLIALVQDGHHLEVLKSTYI